MKMMTEYQRELVAQHLSVVDSTIKRRIKVNGCVLQTYEDFYQIGCEALCKAAMSYNPEVGAFEPFGARYVYNAIIDHCRHQNMLANIKCDVDVFSDADGYALTYFGAVSDLDEAIDLKRTNDAIKRSKHKYDGITLRGIEAIELKSVGYTTREIADRYGTTVNNVNAWISRARSRLRMDPDLAFIFAEGCC